MQSKYATYAKNLTTYFGASLIPMLLSLVTNPLIAKNMSPKDYAISGYYQSFTSLISPIIVFYLVHYYIKEYFKQDETKRLQLFATIAKALIWFSGVISLLCFVALLLYLLYVNSDFSFPIMPYLAMMVFSLPLTGLYSLQQAKLRMERDAKAFFRLSVVNSVFTLILVLLFVVVFRWGAFGKLLGPLIGNFVIFLFLVFKFRQVWKVRTSISDFKPIFFFCLPLALSAMLGYFTNGFSTTYLESIGDTTEYGIYIVGSSIGAYLTVFATAIGNTFQPDLYETVIKKQWNRYIKICAIEISFITIVAILFILFSSNIISILTAGRYVASTRYAQIIALSTISSGIYYLINQLSIATDHPKLYLYTSVIGSIFIVLLMPVAVNKWSYYGGAWMTVMSYGLFSIINVLLLLFTRFKIIPKSLQ